MGSLGLTLDFMDLVTAYVCTVECGVVQEWNLKVPVERHVKEGDYIVAASGREGSVGICAKLKEACEELTLTVKRPQKLEVTLVKDNPSADGNRSAFGFRVTCRSESTSVLISEIHEGPLLRWNLEHPDRAVRLNDRIICANACHGPGIDIVKCLQDAKPGDSTRMIISRPSA